MKRYALFFPWFCPPFPTEVNHSRRNLNRILHLSPESEGDKMTMTLSCQSSRKSTRGMVLPFPDLEQCVFALRIFLRASCLTAIMPLLTIVRELQLVMHGPVTSYVRSTRPVVIRLMVALKISLEMVSTPQLQFHMISFIVSQRFLFLPLMLALWCVYNCLVYSHCSLTTLSA